MLDEFQEAFCRSNADNIRLLAPAGSGKTLSLLHRCAAVQARSEGRARFLIVTFTRAARDEILHRLATPEFVSLADSVDVTTLNSWGWKRVRDRHHSPKLLSTTDRKFVVSNSLKPIWQNIPRIADAIQSKPVPTSKLVMNVFDNLKNLGFRHTMVNDSDWVSRHLSMLQESRADRVLEALYSDLADSQIIRGRSAQYLESDFLPFWRRGVKSLVDQSLFSLEDQKYVALLDTLEQIQEQKFPLGGSKFSDIMVDEFQDISPLDLDLISAMSELHRARLTIVGDDDQAIFEWRGATPAYILNPDTWLKKSFETHVLERNYRCPKNIMNAAKRLIENNENRYPKTMTPMNENLASISVVESDDFAASTDFVMSRIDDFCAADEGRTERIALISRKRAQLIPYQIMLAQKNMNFCAAEDLQVFLSDAFESLIEMISLRLDGDVAQRSQRVIDDVLKLCDRVKRFPLSKVDKNGLRQHLTTARPKTIREGASAISTYRGKLKGDNSEGKMAIAFSEEIRAFLESESVSAAIEAISLHFSGLSKDYGKADEDIYFADPPFFHLARFAERYGGEFERFLEDMESAKETLAHIPPDTEAIDDAWERPVHLMTALRAKGKEFHTVVLLDVNTDIWPMKHAKTREERESERRVFYVAMTRAKRNLVATVSKKIGKTESPPSPFLAEAGLVPTLI